MAKLIAALVLCDVVAHGLKAGTVVEASAAVIDALKRSGDVDVHKDAVAAARDRAAPVVRSCIELADEARAARADELRVEIAKLEDLASKPDVDEATKGALATQVLEMRAELDGLAA